MASYLKHTGLAKLENGCQTVGLLVCSFEQVWFGTVESNSSNNDYELNLNLEQQDFDRSSITITRLLKKVKVLFDDTIECNKRLNKKPGQVEIC